jgi:hypothetical protein
VIDLLEKLAVQAFIDLAGDAVGVDQQDRHARRSTGWEGQQDEEEKKARDTAGGAQGHGETFMRFGDEIQSYFIPPSFSA